MEAEIKLRNAECGMRNFFNPQSAFRNLKSEKGMSLIEVLIAGVIFAFVLISFGYMFAVAQGLLGGEGERRMALTLAQEGLETRQAAAATTAGFVTLEGLVAGGTIVENPVDATDYPNHQRQTTIVYVEDADYDDDTPADPPTNSLRITVTVFPAGSRPVEFSAVTLVTVVTRP